jgi:hypothetical protein
MWFLLLLGILLWPEATLCVVLFVAGYPVLGIISIAASFWSVKDQIVKFITAEGKVGE